MKRLLITLIASSAAYATGIAYLVGSRDIGGGNYACFYNANGYTFSNIQQWSCAPSINL